VTASSASAASRRTYSGWQRDRSTLMFGLSTTRVLLLVAAVVTGVAWFVTGERLLALPIHAAGIGLLLTLAFLRVAGRTSDEWARTAAGHAVASRGRRTRFLSGPAGPIAASSDGTRPVRRVDLPGVLAPLRTVEVALSPEQCAAVVISPHERFAVVVARVAAPGLLLADTGTENRRIDAWATFLAARCLDRSPIRRVQAVVRAVPDQGQALIRWATEHVDPAAPPAAIAGYDDVLARTSGASVAYEQFLALAVDLRHARGDVAAAGGGDLGAAAAALRQMRTLSQEVLQAGLVFQGWLGARELGEVLRVAFDPRAAGLAAQRRVDPTLEPGVDLAGAGPVAAEAHWGHYQHDSGYSVTYVVDGWPSSPVSADVLRALLAPAGGQAQHRYAMVIDPIPPRKADAMIGAARTSRTANIGIRQRFGQVVPEREHRELEHADRQDAERAAGHGLCRFVGYLTVTAATREALDEACADVESAATRIRTDLRRLWAVQDAGFAATLPLALGLPNRRGVL
jgi:hypothetical protein